MDVSPTVMETESEFSGRTRQELLELARNLDRFGRRAEQFLCQQLEQLETARDDFEREKAAWRRQVRRESRQLAEQRDALDRQRVQAPNHRSSTAQCRADELELPGQIAASAARASGKEPLRILLTPGNADSSQLGLLLFELSQLNRSMGGKGLAFELSEVRRPRRRLMRRSRQSEQPEWILELTASSVLPLAPRGSHVALDVDVTERMEQWITFKSRLLQSSLVNDKLVREFDGGRFVAAEDAGRMIREAARHVSSAGFQANEHGYRTQVASLLMHPGQGPLDRLQSCCELLREETGLSVGVGLFGA